MIRTEHSSSTQESGSTLHRHKRWEKLLHHPAMLPFIGFVVLFVLMSGLNDSFLTVNNLTNVARQVSINAIIAVGMTCAILTGGIDLSVGPVMALSGSIAAGLMLAGIPIPLAMMAALLVGALFGLANGSCIAYLRMPPIIVTLASMGIARGLALLYTGGIPSPVYLTCFHSLAEARYWVFKSRF